MQTYAQDTDVQQEIDHSYKPLTLKLGDDGNKYIRFITWHQMWLTTNNLADNDANFQANFAIRRSRFLTYAQISPRFLILTHFGLNGLAGSNMSSLGNNSDAPQLFLHGAWTEFKVTDEIHAGAGLHYWNGLSRLSSQSTLNFMTLDQSRPFAAWHSLGVTDQFARHIGFYLKGDISKFHYRVSVNNPINPNNSLGAGTPFGGGTSTLSYSGRANPNESGDIVGNMLYAGYFKYDIWDKESHKLPYFVGTYLGKKKVLSVGGGFFMHPDGMYDLVDSTHSSVSHFSGDVFLDMPTGFGAFNALAQFTSFNYGKDYVSRWAGTGTMFYAQVGGYLSDFKIMPYVSYQSASYEGLQDNPSALNAGVNYYVNGHHAKITVEYHSLMNNPFEGAIDPNNGDNLGVSQIRVQAHIFL